MRKVLQTLPHSASFNYSVSPLRLKVTACEAGPGPLVPSVRSRSSTTLVWKSLSLSQALWHSSLRSQISVLPECLALVFRRHGTRDPAHKDKVTGRDVYQMEDPAPNLPGGLRLLISLTYGRQVQYSRQVGDNLAPLQLPAAFGTAQVIGQSARAAGAPRSEGGEGGDLFHAHINSGSSSGGGAAWAEPAQQQQPRVEVTVRLYVRLPALSAARNELQVPSLEVNSMYRLFHSVTQPYQGVGRGARTAAEKISEEERISTLHCSCCLKPLSERERASTTTRRSTRALGAGSAPCATRSCARAEGRTARRWDFRTAAEGSSGCLCWCEPKQAAARGTWLQARADGAGLLPPTHILAQHRTAQQGTVA
jgi:hypothetical protein